MSLVDQLEREQAIDPSQSFIVQAPAGSGKTELLSQRFLKLLGQVTAPEQILALTFTRKAANEMRERILKALQEAAENRPCQSPHQAERFALAKEALAQDQRLGWRLLAQPNRLRIMTLDALCQSLSQAIPLLERAIPFAAISQEPKGLYQAAARACLHYALNSSDYQAAMLQILAHLDNRQDRVLNLFTQLLAAREQWLPIVHEALRQDKSQFEAALLKIEQDNLAHFIRSLPEALASQLFELAKAWWQFQPAAEQHPFADWQQFSALNRPIAQALASLLFTGQESLRKSFDHHVGLKRDNVPAAQLQAIKAQSKELLAELSTRADFLTGLSLVKRLPKPEYSQAQWAILQALLRILPLLAAHLQLQFTEHNQIDFIHSANHALEALGTEESPTDLSLYLDYQIQHILVDEFQDTSISQFSLLSQLVQGWQPGEARSLFLVGDPMQSIYRFRAAEVGLFLRAKEQGIGPVSLRFLALSSNFRSEAQLVAWVNQQFQAIFPETEDMESGAIRFHCSISPKALQDGPAVEAYYAEDKANEAALCLDLIRKTLAENPEDRIAVLVRSRKQLQALMPLLRQAQLPFQGVEINPLSKLAPLQDLWTLTQALLLPYKRLAWLSLLRSPYAGLSLVDLHAIAQFAGQESIFAALANWEQIPLSPEGKQRCAYLYPIFERALANRCQQSLSTWVQETHQQLQGEQIVAAEQALDLEQFYQRLDQFEAQGLLSDPIACQEALDRLYSTQSQASRLQIMTIHKSKGLEFEQVILPGLSSRSLHSEQALMRWLQLPTAAEPLTLVSPIKASQDARDPLYDYLAALDSQKEQYEMQRLLYVAVTRAKKKLYLLDFQEKASPGSLRGLMAGLEFQRYQGQALSTEASCLAPRRYLAQSVYTQPAILPEQRANQMGRMADGLARLIGIAAHKLLQWVCPEHPQSFAAVPKHLLRLSLQQQGLSGASLAAAELKLQAQFERFFADPIGRWILQAHQDEANEYALLCQDEGRYQSKILDRCFVENGKRWIIDFKTGEQDAKSQEKHRAQLEDYAALFAKLEQREVAFGLYYLETGLWLEFSLARQDCN